MRRMRHAPQTRHALIHVRELTMRLTPGDQLPSEREMIGQLQVSRMTLRRALDVLKREGLVKAARGKGFFRATAAGKKLHTANPVIALAFTDMASYNISIVKASNEEAVRQQIKVAAYGMRLQTREQITCLRSLLRQPGLRGLITTPPLIPDQLEALMDTYRALQRGGIHVVFVNAPYAGVRIDNVSFDDATGIAMLTRHLLNLGHRRVAYVGDTLASVRNYQRELGYRQVMRSGGHHGLLIPCRHEKGKTIFSQDPVAAVRTRGVTALVALNDQIAFDLWKCLEAAGLETPGDVSIVGFDRLEDANYSFPFALTTVRRDRSELGRVAFRLLWSRCVAGGVPGGSHQHIMLPVEFIPGASTARPPDRPTAAKTH